MVFEVKHISKLITIAVVALLTFLPNRASATIVEGKVGSPKELQAFIMHHVSDAHSWHIWGEDSVRINDDKSIDVLKQNSIHIGLPIFLIDGGLVTGNSHNFNKVRLSVWEKADTNGVVLKDANGVTLENDSNYYAIGTIAGKKYIMFHEKIYDFETGLKLDFETGHPLNARPLDFSLTQNVISMLLSVLLLFALFLPVARKYKRQGVKSAPSGKQNFLEIFVLFVRDDIARPNIGEKKHAKYMPYLLTIFFFVWINNLMGLIPFFPGASNVSGNIAFTAVLSIITYLITQFSGNKNYWKHVFLPPVPKALYPIMIPVEIIGTLTKPFALTIRLFANITAGHIVVLAFMGIIFSAKNIAWSGLSVPMGLFISVLELLVAFLQAFIFTMLSALFIGTAVEEHDHH
jgi:F-type H+-transporting ATPase subunit a